MSVFQHVVPVAPAQCARGFDGDIIFRKTQQYGAIGVAPQQPASECPIALHYRILWMSEAVAIAYSEYYQPGIHLMYELIGGGSFTAVMGSHQHR